MSTPATKNDSPTITGVIRYQVLVRWASGGMADIYVARQTGAGGFGKLVALKVMRPELAQSDDFRDMFLREARTAALLTHSGIVQTFDAADLNGRLYMALEFVRGETLGRMLEDMQRRGAAFPVPLALEIAREVATSLHYAHTVRDLAGMPLSLVHRDISHANIMLTTEGSVKLIDFGIAKVRSLAPTTQTGVIKGKFAYMSPEQAHHEELDPRSDVYSLGVVLWELLTGKRAHTGDSDISVLKSVLNRPLEAPSGLRADLPSAIDAVVMKAVARDRADRYADAGELADALSRVRSELYPGYIARNELHARIEGLFAKRGAELDRILAARNAPALDLASPDFELPGVLPTVAPPTPQAALTPARGRRPMAARIPPPPPRTPPPPPPSPPARSDDAGPVLEDYAMLLREEGDPTVAYPGGVMPGTLPTSAGYTSAGGIPAARGAVGLRSQPVLALAVVGLVAAAAGVSWWAASASRDQRSVPAPDTARHERSAAGGTVVVRSDPPGARVRVDGALQPDTTPLVVTELRLGDRHTVVVELDDHEPVVTPLEFAGATTRTVNATLVPLSSGFLAATCAPGTCEVRVDGHPVGTTPVARHRLLASRPHRVELVQNGRIVLDEEVTLTADEVRTLMADMSAVRRERRTHVGSGPSASGTTGAAAVVASAPAAEPGGGGAAVAAATATPTDPPADTAAATADQATPPANGTTNGPAAASKSGAASARIRSMMGRYLNGPGGSQ